jgi:hypothetical protein
MSIIENTEYNIDSAWKNFLEIGDINDTNISNIIDNTVNLNKTSINIPKGTDIYISTKTKIAYLSTSIELFEIFWNINIIPFHIPKEGVIKKQMKFNFIAAEELKVVEEKLLNIKNVEQLIITQIINPEGRIKFKDIRKISIGISNKDIISYRTKQKSAFYNCFVLILRVKDDNIFKEIHVKVFNTGKLEIPGIRSDTLLAKVINLLLNILNPLVGNTISCDIDKCETVLINSNFNCGFYINRDKFLDILKYKYKIDCIFDACQYPGIQCKYNYIDEDDVKYKLSFMIFRTGSVLIVGKCTENVLNIIYNRIKNILKDEYHLINVKQVNNTPDLVKKRKIKKKIIYIT